MKEKSLIKSILLVIFFLTNTLSAQTYKNRPISKNEAGTLLYADEIVYNKVHKVITARGNVEIEHEGRVLWADVVTYNENSDLMTASGHVRLDEGQGEIIYLEYAELTGDLKSGFVNHVRMSFADDSRMVAKSGYRENATTSHFENVVYSPCYLCKSDPNKPPFWQVKAKHVVFDEEAEDIYYTDAFMEMFGIPVFYTPYLRHPAPGVKRRTGLLNMMLGYSANIGWYATAEYFWAISKDIDMTIKPLLRADGGGVLGLEYRQRFEKGMFTFDGSVDPGSSDKKDDIKKSKHVRGHVIADGRYDFTTHTRGGFRVERTTDKSYFRRYPQLGYSNRSFLTSKIYGEGFWDRSYGVLQGYSFQGLREGDIRSTTPLLLPWLNVNYLSQPDVWGGRWSLDGDALVLTRQKGTKYGRLSLTSGWQKNYISSWGENYTFGAKARGDFYNVHHYQPNSTPNSPRYNSDIARFFPQAYIDWSYPLFKKFETYRIILEPMMGVVAGPKLSQPSKLPNEDGGIIEFSDANLMSDSRFAGLDRIDSGSRFNYGLNMAEFSNRLGNAGIFVGQSIAFQEPGAHLAETGLDKRVSDIVARVKYNYQDWLNIKSRFLMNHSSFHFRRNETSMALGKPILRLTTTYIHLPLYRKSIDEVSDKQLGLTLSSKFHENWTASLSTTRDIGKNPGSLSQGVGLTYSNECFTLSNTLTKTFFNDHHGLKPGFIYMLRVSFKNLGEFSHKFGFSKEEPGSEVKAF